MVDVGDETAALVFRLSQDEISRLLHAAGRAGLRNLAPILVSGFTTIVGPLNDKGEVVDGANLMTDRTEFERVVRDAARKSGLSVEDSEWEAQTVTDMLDAYQKSMRAEFARRGFDQTKWGVEVINGAFEDETMVTQVKVTCPKNQADVARAISSIVAQRVSNQQAFDTLVMERGAAEYIRDQMRALNPKAPIEMSVASAREGFVSLAFPRASRSEVDLLIEDAALRSIGAGREDVISVEIPAAELERLINEIRRQRKASAPGDVSPARVLGASESDALTEPVFVLDTSKRGAEVATLYTAAREQNRLLNDIQKLGIKDSAGKEITGFRSVLADKDKFRDSFESTIQKAVDIARSIPDIEKNHPSFGPNMR